MEDVSNESNGSKKRARDDTDFNSPESLNVNSDFSDLNSSEAKRIRDDILELLGDSDTVTDRDSAIQDLDSVIRSFEEEILHQSPQQPAVLYPSSDSGKSQPELGFLQEASDDELGLPPAISSGEQTENKQFNLRPVASPEAARFGEMMGFDDKIPSYDSFEFENFDEIQGNVDINCDFVTLGGLFDYSDTTDFPWRPESLPAL